MLTKKIKTIETYQTRDGAIFNEHVDALVHEYERAIPTDLISVVKTILDSFFINPSAQQLEDIANGMLNNNERIAEILKSHYDLGGQYRMIMKSRERAAQAANECSVMDEYDRWLSVTREQAAHLVKQGLVYHNVGIEYRLTDSASWTNIDSALEAFNTAAYETSREAFKNEVSDA
jgi:kynurenine formamidase